MKNKKKSERRKKIKKGKTESRGKSMVHRGKTALTTVTLLLPLYNIA